VKKLTLKDATQKNDDNTYFINEQSEPEPSDAISLKAIDELLNKKRIKTISRLKFEQIPIVTKLHLFADTFGTSFPKKLAENIMELQISVSGLGRKELVQLVQRRDGYSDLIEQRSRSKDIFR
jgi:hypothetical protein